MLERSSEKVAKGGSKLKLLGVSVLTSFSEDGWVEKLKGLGAISDLLSHEVDSGIETLTPVKNSIHHLSLLAKECGIPGMVGSALDLKTMKSIYPDVYAVTPGIRLEASTHEDQKRVCTPLEAKNLGTNAIVMGRPIFNSENPRKTLEKVLKDLE